MASSSTRLAALLGRAVGPLWASTRATTHAVVSSTLTRTRSLSSSSAEAARVWREATTPTAQRLLQRAATWFPDSERTAPENAGLWRYWTEQGPGQGGPVMLRAPMTSPWTVGPDASVVVLDSVAILESLHATGGLKCVKISPCGDFVAVVADSQGEPCASARDIRHVEGHGMEIARLPGALGVEWGAIGTGTLYYTLDREGDGRPCEVRVAPGLAKQGRSRKPKRADDHPRLLHLADPHSHLALSRTKDGQFLVATAVRRDAAVPHVLRLGRDEAGLPRPSFTRVGCADAVEACVETFVEGDGRGGLLLLTNERSGGWDEGVSGHEVWLGWAPMPSTPPPAWVPLIPRRPGVVITDMDAFCGDQTANTILLYGRETEFGAPGLSTTRLVWKGKGNGDPPSVTPPAAVALPGDPAAWACIKPGANACPHTKTARIISSSPLSSPRPWDLDLTTGRLAALPLSPAAETAAAAVAKDAGGLTLRRITIPSGSARIPLTVIESDRPTAQPPPGALLVLYGAYGTPLEPDFEPLWFTLAAEGWQVVLAGVRGGGELGRAWHAAGRGANRPNAAKDAEAAADWAGGTGGVVPVVCSAESAGGLLAGHLLQRGGLAAAVLRSPFLDICTHALERDEGGGRPPSNPIQRALALHEVGEWAAAGDVAALEAACPATRLRSQPYPPVMPPVRIVSGADDERTPMLQITNWTAGWQQAASPGRLTEANPLICMFLRGCGHEGPQGEDALNVMACDAAFAVKAAAAAVEARK